MIINGKIKVRVMRSNENDLIVNEMFTHKLSHTRLTLIQKKRENGKVHNTIMYDNTVRMMPHILGPSEADGSTSGKDKLKKLFTTIVILQTKKIIYHHYNIDTALH